ncbi:AbgT family transporter [Fusobacterium sp.]|uniref:YfcC family protein n=1 Tax=Fusobacterium sp. TaxID=68766 RepID=UPI002619B1E3|nr:AbgT family transporter [Fusobacterium sp.]
MSKKKAFKLPHTFIILTIFISVISILSYIIPAGTYERIIGEDGRAIVDPNTFQYIKNTPVSLMQFLTAIPQGYVEAGFIIALTLCVGAGVAVVQRIGVIPAAVEYLATNFKDKGIFVIPILMLIFSLSDAFIGVCELCIIYIPIIMPLMLRLGFDSITACAVALCGSAAGFSAALTNPFTLAIGQKISGLPLYSGWEFRVITYIITLSIGILYVMNYAKKIQNNPELSTVYEEDKEKRIKLLGNSEEVKTIKLNKREKIAGIYSIIMLVIMLGGVLIYKWDMPQMCAMFLLIGVGAGVIAGLNGNELCETLLQGCQDMLMGAVIIGIARGISVVMSAGNMTDTVVNFFAQMLQNIPPSLTAIGMLIVVSLMNFLIPSGSGKAVVLFPILSPLADVVGITRQTAILAYQFGDGFSNIMYPTSGYFMACISNAGVSWQKWIRFFTPLFIIWTTVAAGYLVIAQFINYGPF